MIEYYYDVASNITERKTYLSGGSSVLTPPDDLGRASQRSIVAGGNTISSEAYGYDSMSRLTTVDRTEDGRRDQFGYDQSSQLTSAQYGLLGGINPNRAVGYVWDKAGNRSSVTENTVPTAYTTNNLNQYLTVGAQPVVNGAEHAIASYEGAVFTHINDERLSGVVKGTDNYALAYDALGRTVKRTFNGSTTYYFYDAKKPILERGAVQASNIFGIGIDEIAIRFTPTVVHYFYQDHEGSVTHVRSNSGQVVETYRYDAFGAPAIRDGVGNLLAASAIGNRFMFTGREYAPGTLGFYEYRARAYHPGLGRFMSEDPIGFAAGDYNLYRYCGNDPLDRVDPTGLVDSYTMSSFLRADWIANSAGISNADMVSLGLHFNSSGLPEHNSGNSSSDRSMGFRPDANVRESFQAARRYLSKDGEMRRIFQYVDNSNTRVFVHRTSSLSPNDTKAELSANGNIHINWNPNAAKQLRNGSQSPALALGHEVSHAERFIRDPVRAAVDTTRSAYGFGNQEERRVILGPEARAARTLGETPRVDRRGAFYWVEGVTDR